MEKFTQHLGVAAALLQANIDTDVIIPSREMKRVSKQGLGEGLFANRRYTLPGSREINPDFVLNKPEYANTSILLSGDNFGCGSSREHAVWALKEYGIRAIIAEGFGSIFYNNCIRNGLLPLVLSEKKIASLVDSVSADPQANRINIDLEKQKVTASAGQVFDFVIKPSQKEMLVHGLDAISLTMTLSAEISAFQQQYVKIYTWLN
ncbi:3-isopropylmalate dehydratase small subunit [Glaciecola punicea]|jgi:3-isopropylmalate/(R)-2-methylmalate dehydratase small subunit|uniref:3-isopropylmalate dehydratase small subunit n=1 Tax=Glaciecola punicea TaxID=56804 RepID=UPI000873141F|nr:3-isopropylmalate dehydratase small subunit [Glaciecola punicea]OFA29862.1 3-isopropylmalate dehydratase small subunit [Glaciecola punicea]